MSRHARALRYHLAILFMAVLVLGCGSASAQKDKGEKRVPGYKTIPSASFFTVNAEYLGGYRPDQFFNPQVPAFGFKLGTMRNVGWFVGAMTNFNFKGAFVTCDESEIIPGSTSSSYFEAFGGITLRYWRPLSFHLGLGYSYRSFNNETVFGQWAHMPLRIAQGPMATAGFMFHLGGFVISAEVVGSYNMQGLNMSNYQVDKTRFTFGAKAGLGICIPYKYRDEFDTRSRKSTYNTPGPVTVNQPAAPEKAEQSQANANQSPNKPQENNIENSRIEAEPKSTSLPQNSVLTVVTLPVTQLAPGWLTVCGEVADEGEEPVIERGICWSTSPYPSVTGPHSSDGQGTGYFTTAVSDLLPGTLYYFRAYAGTRSGIRYGNTISVTIPNFPQPAIQQPQPPTRPTPVTPAATPAPPAPSAPATSATSATSPATSPATSAASAETTTNALTTTADTTAQETPATQDTPEAPAQTGQAETEPATEE